MSLARRRIEISSLTNPAPTEDDWRRSLPAESGLRASLDKEVWDVRKVDEDYEDAVKVDECDDGHVSGHDESSRSASGSVSHTHTRSPSSSPNSPEQSLPALPSQWAWPRIPNPHPSLLTAVQADAHTGPVRPRREVAARQTPVPLAAQRTRTTAPVPVEGLTKKSRGRRVPTTHAAATDGDIVFQAGKDGDKMTRMFACTVDGCGKCFHRGEHLKRHIRSIHTNERPHSCPEADCLKTFSRHDNLIQHMKTHGRMLPLMLPGASDSQESLDARQPPQTAYRYYPGPMANMPGSRSSPDGASEHPESEAEPESEDEVEHVVHSKLPYKAKSEDEGMDDRLVSDNDPMDVDDQPSHESTPVLGRPKSVQVPLVFQNGLTGAVSGVGTFSPPNGRSRQPSERSIGSPQGELHCPHAPCGKTFRRGEHLRRHIRGIHLAERPHECQHPGCGKTFSRHDNLMQHAKRHARPSDGRKSVARKRTQSAQSATTEGDEPEFESEDEC